MKTSAVVRRDHIARTTLYTIYTFTQPDPSSALAHKRWSLNTTTTNLFRALRVADRLAQQGDISRVEVKKRWHCPYSNTMQEETVRVFDPSMRGFRGLWQSVLFWCRQIVFL